MRQTVKDISSILIITIVVLSLVYVFTTRIEAASYDYILYDNNIGAMIVSSKPLSYGVLSSGSNFTWVQENGSDYTSLITSSTNTVFYYTALTTNVSDAFIETFFMIPVTTSDGSIETFDVYKGSWGYAGNYFYTIALNVSLPYNIYFKGTISSNYTPTGWSGTVSELPDNIGGKPIEDIINDVLNSTTTVSNQANTYVTNITNVYTTYVSGGITLEEAKQQVQDNIDSLGELANEDTATLKDAVNVTNALTYGQTINDTLLQEQEEAFWETRDIGDETSANAQLSDQEEIDYLNSLIAETTEKISDLSPSEDFTPEQISTTTEIIEGIWENPIVSKIIPLAACFMVICVALGIKYRL